MPWIEHPATQDGPVSLLRWLKFHLGEWMQRKGNGFVEQALYPERTYCSDCGQPIRPGQVCDHIPF